MKNIFAIIDSRCGDISAIAARWGKSGDHILEGFAIGRSAGIHKGTITDMNSAADSISDVLSKLRKATKEKFRDVYMSLSSPSVEVRPSTGTVLLSKYGKEITYYDVEKCVRVGSVVKMPQGKEPLQRIVRSFSVDGEKEIKNPMGLEGVKLSVELNVVGIDSSAVNNLNKCVALAGYFPSGIVLSALAYSLRTLYDEEKEKGAILVNLCKDMTETVIFHKNVPQDFKVIMAGTNDLTRPDGTASQVELERFVLMLKSLPFWSKVKHVVIIGNPSAVEGLMDRVENMTGCPTRFGSCVTKPFEDLPSERIVYTGALGVLDYLAAERKKKGDGGSFMKRFINKAVAFADEYF